MTTTRSAMSLSYLPMPSDYWFSRFFFQFLLSSHQPTSPQSQTHCTDSSRSVFVYSGNLVFSIVVFGKGIVWKSPWILSSCFLFHLCFLKASDVFPLRVFVGSLNGVVCIEVLFGIFRGFVALGVFWSGIWKRGVVGRCFGVRVCKVI